MPLPFSRSVLPRNERAAGAPEDTILAHPRTIGWLGAAALAMGGSNQSVFLIGALFIGQGAVSGQGSAAVPLLILGVLLAWAAAPGWTELALMSPGRVGGIAAACTDAFRPYSLVLSALSGSCYWWGWVPTCGLSAILSASAIHAWLLPGVPITTLAMTIIGCFVAVNLCGIGATARVAVPIAIAAALLAFVSAFIPVLTGAVDWHAAASIHLTTPFAGWFGRLTSVMAGLYLVGFAAPAFEAAACYVGETIDPARNVPRAMLVAGGASGMYFIVLPVLWLGVVGPQALGRDLAVELGPTFAPLFGSLGKALAIGFMMFNMFSDTLQPLAGASRTLSQLSEDCIFPRFLGLRSERDAPWAAILVTAGAATVFLAIGDPIWLIAAANFTYLLAICLASVAVWLLRRDAPERERPFRAPPGTIGLGLAAAAIWAASAVLGFEQFGLPTVLLGLSFAYAGAALYAWRKIEDRRRAGHSGVAYSMHLNLTAAMVAVLLFDGAGYIVAVHNIPTTNAAMVVALEDIFVVVAMLTVGVGLVLPGMIGYSAAHELGVTNATLRRGTEALEQEISERELAEQRLLHIASHDELTGLANRALFMSRFKHAIASMQRRNDLFAAVLFLDLDAFKLVNDSLGHVAGDVLLIAVARRLERAMRPGDTLARLGGDEFIVLLEDIASEQNATAFAERIRTELKPPFTILERDVFAATSIGIAFTRTGFDSPEDVLRNADIAMYQAKRLGKDRFEIFTPVLLTDAVARHQLQSDLKGALERREFVLFYQPIVAILDGSLSGFEALARWQHPRRGLLGPETFIAAAEESGAILTLGAQLLEAACRQARAWDDSFHFKRSFGVSVNFSARQFSDPTLLAQIAVVLERERLSSAQINVEITESAIMQNPELATQTLRGLRDMGVAVHLDDFGTGYSSLGYLHRFPVDVLKIDRSFISMSGDSLGNPQIVQTITSLARSLSMATTAEGVETKKQLDELRQLGCTYAQGYYFSRPVSAAAATALIAGWHSPAASEQHF